MPSLFDLQNAVAEAKNIVQMKMTGQALAMSESSSVNNINGLNAIGLNIESKNTLSLEQKLEFYYIKGISSQEVGWYKMAHNCFLEHLKIAKELNNVDAIIKSYISLGNVEFFLNNHIESMKHFLQAINNGFKQDINLAHWIARGFLGISNIYVNYKRYDIALIVQRQALIYAKLSTKKELTAQCLLNMLPTLSQLNEFKLASSIANKIINLLQEGEKDEWLAEAYNYQGSIFLREENYEKALESTEKAYKLSDKMNTPWPICLNLSLLGQIFTEKGDYAQAIEYLQKAVHMAKKMNFTELEKQIKHHLMIVFDKTMMHKEVFEIIKDSDSILNTNYKDLNTHIKEQVDNQIKNMDLMLDMLEVVKQNEEHQHRVTLLEEENKIDPLTGIYNRRALDTRLSKAILNREACSLIMMDIDSFKKINDTYGHIVGDRVIKEIANILRMICRKEDLLSRYGGEELAVVVNNKDKAIGIKTAERIRSAVEENNWEKIAKGLKVTISLGLSLNENTFVAPDEWVAASDNQLYRAKHSGKNKVCYETNTPANLNNLTNLFNPANNPIMHHEDVMMDKTNSLEKVDNDNIKEETKNNVIPFNNSNSNHQEIFNQLQAQFHEKEENEKKKNIKTDDENKDEKK